MVIVTSAAVHCCPVVPPVFWREPPSLQPGTGPTPCTCPTLTPAILTSEAGRSPLALEKIA